MLNARLTSLTFAQCRFIRSFANKRPRHYPKWMGWLEEGEDDDPAEMLGTVRTSLDEIAASKEALRSEEQKLPSPFPEDPNAPIALAFNPYEKAKQKCILCELGIKLDYKNARLLQQFVSSFSGRVYDRHITGLCNKQHDALLHTVALSRKMGYMPIMVKEPKYLQDPKLFDPLKPIRPHPYE